MRKYIIAAAAAGALLVAAIPGSAFAHECYNASRGDAGNAGASHSQVWLTVQVEEFFSDPSLGLTAEQTADALGMLADAQANGDIPDEFTIFIGKKTIGEGTPAMDRGGASDGKGIDHIFAAYGEELIGILCEAAPAHEFCQAPA